MTLIDDLEFTSATQAKSFCKWILRISPENVRDEFNDSEWKVFREKRLRRLQTQIDDLSNLSFKSAITCSIDRKKYFKLVKKVTENPLSSQGALIASSRFNYKEIELLLNRAIYFGQDKECCYFEKFHLDIQRSNYTKIISHELGKNSDQIKNSEFKQAEHLIYEYEIRTDKILVLTSESTYKAIGIADRVLKNEWMSVNDEFAIPTASQILGVAARKEGFKGILFTSVRNQTKANLVLFEENTGPLDFKILNKKKFDPIIYETS